MTTPISQLITMPEGKTLEFKRDISGTVWKSSDFRNGQLDVQQRKRREDCD